jgi:predicted nicotinamide N-methyase
MIVVIATEPNRVTVGDPMRGELAHTKAEFLARWERGMMTLDEP